MLLVPVDSVDRWKGHAFAARWQSSSGFPPEIAHLLASSGATRSATPLLAIPAHQVPLRDGSRAAQTDLWVLARTPRGLLSVAVDANAPDPPSVESHAIVAAGSVERWVAICRLLEVKTDCEPAVHYRFFHRTASALLEARRFFAIGAAVIVHSFGATRESFPDFQRFVAVMGGRLSFPGELVSVAPREGLELHFGWAQSPIA